MNYRGLAFYILDQGELVTRAPLAFGVAIVLASILIWRLMKLVYDDRLARMRKAIERKDSMIRLLKEGRPPLAPVVTATAPDASVVPQPEPEPDAPGDREARQKALRRITNAIDAAELARHANDPRETARAMEAMGLALHAARITFGLPAMPSRGATAVDLVRGKAMLELVRPALLLDNDDEARRLAQSWLGRNPLESERAAG